ncbi:flagellar hook-basal body complex protein FliE [Sphingomonas mucosissima]|uniref:Flagellar hook-basal body complex protein FliE n=1 Tax=Sphingomonas mucosissima TaxID=370959 RepID=A0A245ZTP9_9SPHN|nr:flagellar hook-basal body complex protein FliE [Sphingomonas mucosissima]OWK33111.1 flagellar hook-basal body complex protein FliE [Sphingomonas mucosissima]
MSIGALDAATAYGRAVGIGKSGGLGGVAGGSAAEETGGGFGDLVSRLVTDTASSLRAAETASAKQVAGKGDLIDVVTAIGAAETALDTVVAVRDRVVGAYSDIMRMQI